MKTERSWKLKLNALILAALGNGEFTLRELVQFLDGQIEHSLGPVKFSLAVHHALARMYAKGRINRELVGRVAKYSSDDTKQRIALGQFVKQRIAQSERNAIGRESIGVPIPPPFVPPPFAELADEPVTPTETRAALQTAVAYQIEQIDSLTF